MSEKELSPAALKTLEWLGNYGPTSNPSLKQIKGYMHDLDGGVKTYINSDALREIAMHLVEVADWLDNRAKEPSNGQ